MRRYTDPCLLSLEALQELGRKFGREHPGYFDEEVAKGRGGRRRGHLLHVGHHGPAQGDDAHAPEPHRDGAECRRARGALRLRRGRGLSAHGVDRRPHVLVRPVHRDGLHDQLPGERRHRPARPEGDRADVLLRAARGSGRPSSPRSWCASTTHRRPSAAWSTSSSTSPGGWSGAASRTQPVPLGDRVLYQLGRALVYGPLRDNLGMRRIRVAYTAGEAIGPELFEFYRSLGINVKQLYGMTESSALVCIQQDGDVKLDTVGTPLPGVELRISDSGEVMYRSPGVFVGYYKNPEATRETLEDGWIHSGDAGVIDKDGHLRIIDRARDVGRLADGTLFAPKYLENKLKFSPYVKEAVCVGAGRPFVAALVNIDLGSVGSWAERRNIAYTSYADLAQKPEVYELIRQEVERVNRSLLGEAALSGAQIRRFLLLHKELDADDQEITRTRKVRRGFVAREVRGADRRALLRERRRQGRGPGHVRGRPHRHRARRRAHPRRRDVRGGEGMTDHGRGRRPPPRRRGRERRLRRRAGADARQPRHPAGRDRRDHRPERRGQDHAAQRDQRVLPRRLGPHPVRGRATARTFAPTTWPRSASRGRSRTWPSSRA